MEEIREQPAMEQAEVSSETSEECAESEAGSQIVRQVEEPEQSEFGKFKSLEALVSAYNNLEAEFTKKCQRLSELEKDKTEAEPERNWSLEEQKFLSQNSDAAEYIGEIKALIENDTSLQKTSQPFESAWAKIFLSHITERKDGDPIVDRYILSNDAIQEKVVQNYLNALKQQNSPLVISSQGGQRVSSVANDTPSSLQDAREMMEKMFS